MITLRKLASLKEGTRQRKYVRLLRTFEETLSDHGRDSVDEVFLRGLMGLIGEDKILDEDLRQQASLLSLNLWDERAPQISELRRSCNQLRHKLLADLNMEPGDWDLMEPQRGSDFSGSSLPLYLYLDDIRSPFNVGAIFRTAEAMGVREIFLSPGTASPDHNRARRSAMGAIDMVPWRILNLEDLDMDCFALELGGKSPDEFVFPDNETGGCIILGSEELGVSPEGLARAEESLGRVSLPMRGKKGSLNVAVATGIILYCWTSRFS